MEKRNKKRRQVCIKKYLPHNFLAEKSILSNLLINRQTIELILQHLTIETFYFRNHQELYRAIIFLYQKNFSIDLVTLTSFLQDNGLLEKIGGLKILIELINQIPNMLYIEEYIKLLQDKFLRRTLIKLGYQIINSSYITNIPLENILNDLEIKLFNVTNRTENNKLTTSAELLAKVFFDLKQKSLKEKLPGLESGFKKLDLITQGFQTSDLIIVAGRPGMGKTAFCLNIITSIVKTYKLPVIFFSLEMAKEQLMYRLLSNETEISNTNLRTGNINKQEWVKLSLAIKKFSSLPIFIDDTTNISIQTIRLKLKKILFEQTKIGIIIIDYLQLMQNSTSKIENRVQELSQITRNLKSIAREFKIPVIALSQLSRNVETRINKRPQLSDLRESGSIEQDADLVLMLFRENYYNLKKEEQDLAEIIIAKHRNGPMGTIQLKFDANCMKFSNCNY
jgi:replicative DNA helicase